MHTPGNTLASHLIHLPTHPPTHPPPHLPPRPTLLLQVCSRKGLTGRALSMYAAMNEHLRAVSLHRPRMPTQPPCVQPRCGVR